MFCLSPAQIKHASEFRPSFFKLYSLFYSFLSVCTSAHYNSRFGSSHRLLLGMHESTLLSFTFNMT